MQFVCFGVSEVRDVGWVFVVKKVLLACCRLFDSVFINR